MKTILINFDNETVQTALVENGQLTELLLDDRQKEHIVGNIYLGVVKNILQNQFVFIDIGLPKNAFLDLNDSKERAFKVLFDEKNLRPGDHILIQIMRDETDEKGAAATTQISVSNNCFVLFKDMNSDIGISKKIENVAERKRLRKIAASLLPKGFGLVARTGCEGISEEEMSEKIQELALKHEHIVSKAKFSTAPNVIQKEEYFLASTLNAIMTNDVDKIVVNDENELQKVKAAAHIIREIEVELHTGHMHIFSDYFPPSQIEEAFSRKIWLKSGGFIVIDHAEAGILIDVNSGKFVGKSSHQKTALKIDREAAAEIARQIRLRNLSGMILIDFIDLRFEENRVIILKEFENELKKDRINVNLVGMMGHGLVMLTRKRTRGTLGNSPYHTK